MSSAHDPLLGGNGNYEASLLTIQEGKEDKLGWADELKVLMQLSGPAIFQLAGQQG